VSESNAPGDDTTTTNPVLTTSSAAITFKRALDRYKDTLKSSAPYEIEEIKSLEDVTKRAQELVSQHKLRGSSITMKLSEKLGKARDNLRPFDDLVKGGLRSCPIAGEALWGTVAFTYRLAEDSKDSLEAVFDFFIQISERLDLPIVKTLINAFPDSELVQIAGEQLFAILLDFWVDAVEACRKAKFVPGPVTFTLKPKFDRMTKEIDRQLRQLRDAAAAQSYEVSQVAARRHEQFWKGNKASVLLLQVVDSGR
jgi:hypothetical protein